MYRPLEASSLNYDYVLWCSALEGQTVTELLIIITSINIINF
jgi:hypothetical protein